MPLSEQEQRLLDEMERSLYRNDADDVTRVGPRRRASYSAIALGIIAGVAGVVLLVVGVVVRQPIVGVVGFGLMFTGALLGFAPPRRLTRDAAELRQPGLMDELGKRFDNRGGTD